MAKNSRSCALKALGLKDYLLPPDLLDVTGMFVYLIAGFPRHPGQRAWKNLLAVSLREIARAHRRLYGRNPKPRRSLGRLLALELNERTAALQSSALHLLNAGEAENYADEGQVKKDWLRQMGVRFRSRRGVLAVLVCGEIVVEVDFHD